MNCSFNEAGRFFQQNKNARLAFPYPSRHPARNRNCRGNPTIRSLDRYRNAGEALGDLLIVARKALRAHAHQLFAQLVRIGDRVCSQGRERSGRKIGLAFGFGQIGQQDLADAGAIGFQLQAHLGEEVPCPLPGLETVGHHIVFQRAELDHAAHLRRKAVEHRRGGSDDHLFLIRHWQQGQQAGPRPQPSAGQTHQEPFGYQRRYLPMRGGAGKPDVRTNGSHAAPLPVRQYRFEHGETAAQGGDGRCSLAHAKRLMI